jgi:hypothetical protein
LVCVFYDIGTFLGNIILAFCWRLFGYKYRRLATSVTRLFDGSKCRNSAAETR